MQEERKEESLPYIPDDIWSAIIKYFNFKEKLQYIMPVCKLWESLVLEGSNSRKLSHRFECQVSLIFSTMLR